MVEGSLESPAAGAGEGRGGEPDGIVRRILWISLGLLGANLVGSAFNIWYNLSHLRPLLTESQAAAFSQAIGWFNAIVYPLALGSWILVVLSLVNVWNSGESGEVAAWKKARCRVINLPWIGSALSGFAWLASIPVLLSAVDATPDPLDPRVSLHLPVSIIVAALIACAHGFFVVEILTQRLLYPLMLEHDEDLGLSSGAIPITLRRRGMIWAVSAVVCPIVALMLLFIAAAPSQGGDVAFPLSVGLLGIAFGFASAWLLSRIVVEPVEELRRGAHRVDGGDLETRIDLIRTDEFGPLIGQFNRMVAGLREKQRVEAILGRNVGIEVARLLLEQGEQLEGAERRITVLFTDIREFTPRCARSEPRHVVSALNIFFDIMVTEVEKRRGVVTNFVGDGFMAVFGAIDDDGDGHATQAAETGRAMLGAVERVNASLAEAGLDPLEIGIGVNTGSAVVGSVGATGRTVYTAIGDTVNVSARIESLTKVAGYRLLLSEETYEALPEKIPAERLEPITVKGKVSPIVVYGIK